nr:hypothetical protein CFP56_71335 [Quercus suber]
MQTSRGAGYDHRALGLGGSTNRVQGSQRVHCDSNLGRAIILAHISPVPTHASYRLDPRRVILPDEGDNHFNNLLDSIQQLYNVNRAYFPARSTGWGVFGRYQSINDHGQAEITWMSEKLDILRQRLSSLGLSTSPIFYDVKRAQERSDPAAGTVIGIIMNGKTYLYVEDVVRHSFDFGSASATATANTSALISSSNIRRVASGPSTAVVIRATSFSAMQAAGGTLLVSSGLARGTVMTQLQDLMNHHRRVGSIQSAPQVLLRATYDVLINQGYTDEQARGLVARIPRFDEDDEDDDQ